MRRGTALFLALTALAAVACSGGGSDALPKVPDFTPAATTTTDVDYSQVPLKGVTGRAPTTSVVFGPGKATLMGTVVGDQGAIPGATVRIERIVSGAVGMTMVLTGADGTWTLPQILGGRYRVRAWLAPDLVQTSSSAVFVGATESKTMQLKVRSAGGLSVRASIAPDPPRLGEDANLVVQVVVKVVDEEGVLRATPQDGVRVDLVNGGGWRIESENPQLTDASGRAGWTLNCRSSTRGSLAVAVGTQTVPIEVSSCVAPAEESTTTTEEFEGIQ